MCYSAGFQTGFQNVDEIVRINKKCWEIGECFRIVKTEFKTGQVLMLTSAFRIY